MTGLESLAGRVAVVTGASRGIGRTIAVALAAEGMNLVLTARDGNRLEETANLSAELGDGETLCIEADLVESEAPNIILNAAEKKYGVVDLLVCNAGVSLNSPLEETTVEQWDRLLTINARAPFLLYKHALPLLRRSQNPVIVAISSVVGRIGYPRQTAYTASKHALAGLTKAFAREVQYEGIRVHLISPGGVATDMIRAVRPDIDENELISPEEIARIVVFLATFTGNGIIDEISVRRSTGTPWQ